MNTGTLRFLLLLFFTSTLAQTQNTDQILREGLEAYRNGEFAEAIDLANKGLRLAPEYHDIRLLRVRSYFALDAPDKTEDDLVFLLDNDPGYPGVRELVLRRIDLFSEPELAFEFLTLAEKYYSGETSFEVKRAQVLSDARQLQEARSLSNKLLSSKDLSGEQRYLLQNIMRKSVRNEIGINYSHVRFSEEYNNRDQWNTWSLEYLHNFGKTTGIARVYYADRGFSEGTLYELEAYPVFSDQFYALLNVGYSEADVFPDLRMSASLYHSFLKVFEGEAGTRFLKTNGKSFFTGIVGVTNYTGKFYFNFRAFLGPEKQNKLIQNYQFNTRFYLKNPDHYLLGRIGNGISPDEVGLYTPEMERPELDSWYGHIGLNQPLGTHHIFQISIGMLLEELSPEENGNQLFGNIGYRYQF